MSCNPQISVLYVFSLECAWCAYNQFGFSAAASVFYSRVQLLLTWELTQFFSACLLYYNDEVSSETKLIIGSYKLLGFEWVGIEYHTTQKSTVLPFVLNKYETMIPWMICCYLMKCLDIIFLFNEMNMNILLDKTFQCHHTK